MIIKEWDLSESGRLAKVYNAQATEVPYEYPVDGEALAGALSQPSPAFADGRLLVYEERGQPQGFVHAGTIPKDDSGEREGLIRYLCFPRDRRGLGQALLDCAHEYLSGPASTCRAFRQRFGYGCTWYGHLKSPWEHVYALLGGNGYRVDGTWGLVMVLRDYQMAEPVLPDGGLEVQVDDTPIFPHLTSHGDLPTVVVRLYRGGELIGGNETRPYYLPHWDRAQQDMCYTTGMGVNDTERGRGFGRYLMERSLHEMQRLGCRHAILDVNPLNFSALMLYASMGYRTCFQGAEMTRIVDGEAAPEK